MKTIERLFVAAAAAFAFSISAFAATTYYVAENGDDSSATPSDPSTPLKTIATALGKAAAKDVISVAAGTYELTSTLTVGKAVTIEGSGWRTCTLTNVTDGIGVVKITAAATVKGFTITGGSLAAYMAQGSGVYMSDGTLSECRVTGNLWGTGSNKQMYGFGVYLGGAYAKVTHCIIDHNGSRDFTRTNGGGIYAAAKAKVDNCLIVGNEAGVSGGGVYLTADATFTNCTIADNYALTAGGGSYGNFGTFVNCVFRGNVADGDSCEFAPDIYTTSAAKPACSNCIFEKAVRTGSGNVVQDPVFASDGSYGLLPPSLAIDGGDDTVYTEGDLDLAGNPRLRGDHVDAGCYESDPTAAAVGFYASAYSGKTGDTITLHGGVSGLEGTLGYSWTVKNETTSATVSAPSVPEPALELTPGTYSVKFTVTAGSTVKEYERKNLVFVGPATCYVDPDSTTGAFPYDSAETAAPTLEAAYAACAEGGEIVLPGKTIERTSEFAITKPVTVRGSSAAGATVLRQTKKSRVVYLNNSKAVLANVTVTGGSADYGSGIYVGGGGGLVTNCIICGNASSALSYGHGALHLLAGRATRCTVYGSSGGGGGAFPAVTVYGPATLECSVISNNVANQSAWAPIHIKEGGLMDSCLIVDNYGARGGAVYSAGAGTVRNCTITRNKTGSGAGGVRIESSTSLVFINCLIADNESSTGSADWSSNLAATTDWTKYFKYCFFDANPAGECPVFSDNPGFKGADSGDFTLKSSSKAVNAGTDAYGLGVYDLAGNDRMRGEGVDIGCYESDPNVLGIGFDAEVREGFVGTEFAFTSTVTGTTETPHYSWRFESEYETFTSTEANPKIRPQKAGWFKVQLHVTAGTESEDSEESDYIHTAQRNVYVTQDAGAGVYPYDSAEKATDDFAAAWRETISGATMHVSGMLAMASTLSIAKPVTVVGVCGRDVDGLSHAGGNVVLLNHADAVVRGLKLTGGTHGVEIASNGGTVEDCLITGNSSAGIAYSSGGGVYLDGDAGVVRRTIITGNRVGSGGGQNLSGGAGVYIRRGVLESCLVSGNIGGGDGDGVYVASAGAKVRNCTIIGNHQDNSRVGGGLFFQGSALSGTTYPEILNTLVVSNTATSGEIRNLWVSYKNNSSAEGAVVPLSQVVSNCLTTCAFDATNETGIAGMQLPVTSDSLLTPDPGFTDDGSCRLVRDSCLRDRGTFREWMRTATDLYGLPRCDYGKHVDIGCCEAKSIHNFYLLIR